MLSFLNQWTYKIVHGIAKKKCSEHVVYKYFFECQNKNTIFVLTQHVLYFSYCGLTDARMRAYEKGLPVPK